MSDTGLQFRGSFKRETCLFLNQLPVASIFTTTYFWIANEAHFTTAGKFLQITVDRNTRGVRQYLLKLLNIAFFM